MRQLALSVRFQRHCAHDFNRFRSFRDRNYKCPVFTGKYFLKLNLFPIYKYADATKRKLLPQVWWDFQLKYAISFFFYVDGYGVGIQINVYRN